MATCYRWCNLALLSWSAILSAGSTIPEDSPSNVLEGDVSVRIVLDPESNSLFEAAVVVETEAGSREYIVDTSKVTEIANEIVIDTPSCLSPSEIACGNGEPKLWDGQNNPTCDPRAKRTLVYSFNEACDGGISFSYQQPQPGADPNIGTITAVIRLNFHIAVDGSADLELDEPQITVMEPSLPLESELLLPEPCAFIPPIPVEPEVPAPIPVPPMPYESELPEPSMPLESEGVTEPLQSVSEPVIPTEGEPVPSVAEPVTAGKKKKRKNRKKKKKSKAAKPTAAVPEEVTEEDSPELSDADV